MGCRDAHESAVGRKAKAMAEALLNGQTEEALCGHHPKLSRTDCGPVNRKMALESLVAYLSDLRGVSTMVRSYEKGLVLVYLGDIKVMVQVNCKEEDIFNENTIIVKITGRDIEHGKVTRSAGSLILNKIWLSAPIAARVALAKENGL